MNENDRSPQATADAPATYDAFLSYSSTDAAIARQLHRAVQQIGNPPWRRRSHRIFRDEASLDGSERLWGGLRSAVDSSDHFILLASPSSAQAYWVRRELAHFLTTRRDGQELLIVLADGAIVWDKTAGTLDRTQTTAFPSELAGYLEDEPLYQDLTSLTRPSRRRERRTRLRSAAASIAAVIRGRDKDDIIGDHIAGQRRNLALVALAAALLGVLAILARTQQLRAEDEERQQRAEAVSSLALSVDERDRALLLAVAGVDIDETENTVRHLVDATFGSGRVRHFSHLHDRPVRTVATDGVDRVVTADEGGTIIVRDSSLDALGDPISTSGGSIREIAFFPDDRRAVIASDDGSVSLLDLTTSTVSDTAAVSVLEVRSVAVSPDGERVYVGTWDGRVVVLDDQLAMVEAFAVDFDRVHSLAVTPDGERLVVGGRRDGVGRGRVAVLSLPGGETVEEADVVVTVDRTTERLRTVSSVAVDPVDPGIAYFGSFSGVVATWNHADGLPPHQLGRHDEQIARVRVDPGSSAASGGAQIAAAGFDGSVRVWSSNGRPVTGSMFHHGPRTWDAAFIDDGRALVTAGDDGSVARIDVSLPAPPAARELVSVGSPDLLTMPGSDGAELLVSAEDAELVARDAESLAELDRIDAGVGVITAMIVSTTDDRTVLVGGAEGDVGAVDLWTGGRQAIGTTSLRVSALAAHPTSGVIAVGGSIDDEGAVEFVHDDPGASVPDPVRGLDDATLLGLEFTADGEYLLLSGTFRHESVRRWPSLDVVGGADVPQRTTHATFLGDGTWAFATDAQDIELARVDGTELGVLSGTGDVVVHTAYDPGRRMLASGAVDGTIRLWELQGRAAPLSPTTPAHRSLLEALVFSADGSRLFTASRTEVLVWELEVDALRTVACDVARRRLRAAEWDELIGDGSPPDVC
ncbi:MAG: TIR domain-containing protein [Actinomycetota bacterium]